MAKKGDVKLSLFLEAGEGPHSLPKAEPPSCSQGCSISEWPTPMRQPLVMALPLVWKQALQVSKLRPEREHEPHCSSCLPSEFFFSAFGEMIGPTEKQHHRQARWRPWRLRGRGWLRQTAGTFTCHHPIPTHLL